MPSPAAPRRGRPEQRRPCDVHGLLRHAHHRLRALPVPHRDRRRRVQTTTHHTPLVDLDLDLVRSARSTVPELENAEHTHSTGLIARHRWIYMYTVFSIEIHRSSSFKFHQ